MQASRRCTRGPKDWAVVVVAGEDILRFLSRAEVRTSLPVELQAEITFGLEQSQAPADDLRYLVESALEQDEIWQEDAGPELAKLRREATRAAQPNVAELAASTVREVRAWAYAWQQDWEPAARAAVEVYENLTAPGLRPYRALWAYLGSAWSALASTDDASPAALRSAELLRVAHRAAVGTTAMTVQRPMPLQPQRYRRGQARSGIRELDDLLPSHHAAPAARPRRPPLTGHALHATWW